MTTLKPVFCSVAPQTPNPEFPEGEKLGTVYKALQLEHL
jgi:hypothetical protein